MPSEFPITPELRDAFSQAIAAFENWDYGEPEPEVSFEHRPYPLPTICNFVIPFRDDVPDWIYLRLVDWSEKFRNGDESIGNNCDGPPDQTYEAVAGCLYRLYNARRDHFARLTQRHGS